MQGAVVIGVEGVGPRGNGEGDEASKPQQRGQAIDAQDDELVAERLVEPGHKDLVGDHQQSPDGAKEDEGELRRGVGVTIDIAVKVRIPGVGHCTQRKERSAWCPFRRRESEWRGTIGAGAEDDDGEDELHDATGEDDSVEHSGTVYKGWAVSGFARLDDVSCFFDENDWSRETRSSAR